MGWKSLKALILRAMLCGANYITDGGVIEYLMKMGYLDFVRYFQFSLSILKQIESTVHGAYQILESSKTSAICSLLNKMQQLASWLGIALTLTFQTWHW